MAKCGHCQVLTCMAIFCQHESVTTLQDAVVKLIRCAAEIKKLKSGDGHVSNKAKTRGVPPTHFITLADICF